MEYRALRFDSPFGPRGSQRITVGVVTIFLAWIATAFAEVTFTTIYEFPGAAAKPTVALVKASDGNFYGTTSTKGGYGAGSIYRVTPQGKITTLYSFTGGNDGGSPSSALVEGPDGNLYGVTSFNSNNTVFGTIYKVTPAGALTTIHTFTGPDGQFPVGELVVGNDGKLYGTVPNGSSGSAAASGAVYSITTSGTYTIVYSFKFSDPAYGPKAGLIKGSDGNFYGTAPSTADPRFFGGIVFKITPAGGFTSLYSFKPTTDGIGPGKLVQGSDGNFYGTTTTGGANNHGTFFKVTPAGAFTLLRTADTAANGYPNGVGLIQGSDGNFYGTCSNGGTASNGVVYQLTPAGGYTIIYSFTGVPDGANPSTPLIDGGDGFLYGTTPNGAGDREVIFRGDGTVFKIALNGTFNLMAPFASAPSGKEPSFPLIRRPEGDLVGTAKRGGEKSFGTFFTVSPTGEFKVACNFDPDLNLLHPVTAVVRGADGLFYGFNQKCLGCGSAETDSYFFKVSTSGEAAAINKAGAPPPAPPAISLVLGPDGAFYGMTGGAIVRLTTTGEAAIAYQFQDVAIPANVILTPAGKLLGVRLAFGSTPGSVFLFDPANGAFNTVYTFTQGGSGAFINSPLVIGIDGNFYGTTKYGGTNQQGSVFKITPAGEFSMLYSFTNGADGGQPAADLIQATDGNFYGTTSFGGTNQAGTIFVITAAGALQTLYNFRASGGHPATPLVQAKDGSFYGVSADGGVAGNGTIYRLVVSGVPPVPLAAQLLNISTRMQVLTGNNVLIGGFIVTGTDQKKVLVRGMGPSLPLSGVLADPTLELHSTTTTLAANDNWKDTQRSEIEATTIPPSNDFESAIVATLPANNAAYTAILAGKSNGTGIGLVEVYDLAQSANAKLANISTRGFVDIDDKVMIGGLIVGPGGAGPTKVMVRAIGPSLVNAGITGALQDPTLELRDGNGQLVGLNDNWKDGGQEQAIRDTTIPPGDDRESALVRILAPGNYTAIVRGKANTTGVGLVELYNLP